MMATAHPESQPSHEGHAGEGEEGDAVLDTTSAHLRQAKRGANLVHLFGGDEADHRVQMPAGEAGEASEGEAESRYRNSRE